MLLKLLSVSIVNCIEFFGFVSALLWLKHQKRSMVREILIETYSTFVSTCVTGWFVFFLLSFILSVSFSWFPRILFHSLHACYIIKMLALNAYTCTVYSVYTMVNKNVTIWHADLWMRKYLFIVQQTTNGSINNMRCTFFFPWSFEIPCLLCVQYLNLDVEPSDKCHHDLGETIVRCTISIQ